MKNRLKIINLCGVILLILTLVSARNAEEIAQGKKLVESKIDCKSLTNDQLEAIGEYYMEQMHPGKQHELMDQMHGGEGSVELDQMHQLMAKHLYCNENTSIDMGMMMKHHSGMMSDSNMMDVHHNKITGGKTMMNTGSGMMGGTSMMSWNNGWWSIYAVLYNLLLIGLIVLIILAIIWLLKKIKSQK